MKITGETIVTGIIGYPVRYSLSPLFQNYLFQKYNLNYVYIPFPIERVDMFETALKGLIAAGVKGLNVTIPYKEKAFEIVDKTDQLSSFVKAINTIVVKERKTEAYNTDGPGFWDAMEKRFKIDYEDISLFILGSGGAARGIIGEGIKRGIQQVHIFARSIEKGKKIIDDMTSQMNTSGEVKEWCEIRKFKFPPYSIIVNTTPIGMKGEVIEINWDLCRRETTIVADIVYKPLKTPLLQEAEKRRIRTFPGYLMLAGQGILSFKLWTGILPSFEETAEFIRRIL